MTRLATAVVAFGAMLLATIASSALGQAPEDPDVSTLLEAKRDSAVALPQASPATTDRTNDRYGADHPSSATNKTARRRTRSAAGRLSDPVGSAYSFDEGAGNIARDVLSDHDGVVHGAQWVDYGKYGGALEFDGDNDIVTVPDSPEFDFADGFTIEAWVRPRADADYWKPVVTKETSSGFMAYQLYAQSSDNAKPVAYIANGDWSYRGVAANSPVPLETWSHLAMTSDGTTMRIYVNGTLQSSGPSYDPQTSDGALQIGGNEVWQEYFDGRIDELRIYGDVLTASEIQEDRNTPLGDSAPVPSTELAFSFHEGTGNQARDQVGDHDGTVAGATWTSQGKYGGALNFDGDDGDVVTIPDDNKLDFVNGLTLEAWVKPRSNPHTWAPVITKETTSGFMGYQLYAETSNAAKPAGFVAEGDWSYTGVSGTAALPTGSWSHLAVTSDNQQMRIYINGVLKATGPSYTAQASDGPLRIGAAPVFGEYFDGIIDEVRLYNRPLSASEIVTDRDTPVDYTPPSVATSTGTLVSSSQAIQGQNSYTLNVSATDADSGVKRIDVLVDNGETPAFSLSRTAAECNLSRGRCPTTLSGTWTTRPGDFLSGNHLIQVVAVNAVGQSSAPTAAQFNVQVTGDNTEPTLTVTNVPQTTGSILQIDASDPGPVATGVVHIEAYADGQLIGSKDQACPSGGACPMELDIALTAAQNPATTAIDVYADDQGGYSASYRGGKRKKKYDVVGFNEEINFFPEGTPEAAEVAARGAVYNRINEVGADTIRFYIQACRFNTEPEAYEEIFRQINNRNTTGPASDDVRVLALMIGSPGCHGASPDPSEVGDFATFVTNFLVAYGPSTNSDVAPKKHYGVHAIEIINEPNNPSMWDGAADPNLFADLVNAGGAAVKTYNTQHNRTVDVIAGATQPLLSVPKPDTDNNPENDATIENTQDRYMREAYLRKSAGDKHFIRPANIDAVGIHLYADSTPKNVDVRDRIVNREYKAIVNDDLPDGSTWDEMPIWITEVGFPSKTEADRIGGINLQAQRLGQIYDRFVHVPRVKAFIIHRMFDDRFGEPGKYGLVDYDTGPRRAFTELKNELAAVKANGG